MKAILIWVGKAVLFSALLLTSLLILLAQAIGLFVLYLVWAYGSTPFYRDQIINYLESLK